MSAALGNDALKRMAIGIFVGLSLLLGVSVYVAERTYDGPVEKDYYRRSMEYFRSGGVDPARASSIPLVAVADGVKVVLDIEPKPVKAMRELAFAVEAPGYDGGTPWIDLGMAGMSMAPNRVDLARGTDGRYRGKGVLVRCPSGMRTWTATVRLPGKGEARFDFDVAD